MCYGFEVIMPPIYSKPSVIGLKKQSSSETINRNISASRIQKVHAGFGSHSFPSVPVNHNTLPGSQNVTGQNREMAKSPNAYIPIVSINENLALGCTNQNTPSKSTNRNLPAVSPNQYIAETTDQYQHNVSGFTNWDVPSGFTSEYLSPVSPNQYISSLSPSVYIPSVAPNQYISCPAIRDGLFEYRNYSASQSYLFSASSGVHYDYEVICNFILIFSKC